jgi:hypothetical protein
VSGLALPQEPFGKVLQPAPVKARPPALEALVDAIEFNEGGKSRDCSKQKA